MKKAILMTALLLPLSGCGQVEYLYSLGEKGASKAWTFGAFEYKTTEGTCARRAELKSIAAMMLRELEKQRRVFDPSCGLEGGGMPDFCSALNADIKNGFDDISQIKRQYVGLSALGCGADDTP